MHCISCGHSVYNCSMNRMIWTVAIVGISLLGCKPLSNSGDRVERAGQPDVIGVDRDDVQMKEAENKARARLDYFIEKLQKRSDPSTEYAVKFPLAVEGDIEHIWGAVESYDAKTGFACLLANEPLGKSKYRAGDPITVSKDKVEDWMIRTSDTEWEGGYTSELLKSRAENGK